MEDEHHGDNSNQLDHGMPEQSHLDQQCLAQKAEPSQNADNDFEGDQEEEDEAD